MWTWFCKLAKRRRSNGFGVDPIDLSFFEQLAGVKPTPAEVDLLCDLDFAYFEARQKK